MVEFDKIQLTDKFWSEGVALGDINRDGHPDIVSGPFWYEGPEFRKRHEIFPATQTFTVRQNGVEKVVEGYEGALGTQNAYSHVFEAFVFDFNSDGWPDVLIMDFPGAEAAWYENPGSSAGDGHWKRHAVFGPIGNESPTFVDLFGNGRPVILCMSGDLVGYVAPRADDPNRSWEFHAVSDPLPTLLELRERFANITGGGPFAFAHGLGYGDINGDGRVDILGPEGWWEQAPPAQQRNQPWRFHPWPFLQKRPTSTATQKLAKDASEQSIEAALQLYRWPFALSGAQIYVYDVNGDGLPDVISSLDAHGYGLAWFEQLRAPDSSGEIQFKPHILMGPTSHENEYGIEFTQLHALELTDIDGDGLKDIVTGKRFWAHGREGPDPETNAAAVLYWFRLTRERDGNVKFVPHLIDSDSGVGTQITSGDLNGDGLTDLVVANKKGLFLFLQRVRTVERSEWLRSEPKVLYPRAEQ